MASFKSSGSHGHPSTSDPAGPPSRMVSLDEVLMWLEGHRDSMASRWLLELRSRSRDLDPEDERLLGEFLALLVRLLPECLGAYRQQALPLLHQAAELYGHLAALRGLAAGEGVEEIQLLREVILRFLFRDPPGEGRAKGLGLRELLHLSRLVDQLVTHTSIGHTDTLFFKLFQGHGVPASTSQQTRAEVRDQLMEIREELEGLRALDVGLEDRG
ncbi:MAG: hypothetical protein EA422_06790 [Gemmatimonadales bacterium]|nr:MAG: hypothetical protein EA422_06790 [Gemmatimonadales bacterium]